MPKENTFNATGTLRIIVVEDEEDLRDILVTGLSYFGYDVRGASDGHSLDIELAESPADIIVLDLGLPVEDGLQIAVRLRRTSNYGIVMVTARSLVDERIEGLRSGADLYFVKPVDIRELAIAINNLGSRLGLTGLDSWHFHSKRSVLLTPSGVEIPLTAGECIVMGLLAGNPGLNVPRERFYEKLGYMDDYHAALKLETIISRLRAKVRKAAPQAELPLRARHNMGYSFLADLRE